MKLDPCSHCRSPNPSVKKKTGRVGITRASYYRETVKCKSCNIEVTAGTPGNAIKFWNRSYAGLRLTTVLKCGAVMLAIYASLAAGMYVLTDYAADTLIAENGHD